MPANVTLGYVVDSYQSHCWTEKSSPSGGVFASRTLGVKDVAIAVPSPESTLKERQTAQLNWWHMTG